MTYEYNPKAHYAPYGKHKELITGRDLTRLSIVVKDDNKNSESFSLEVPDSVLDFRVYKYLKDALVEILEKIFQDSSRSVK